MPTGPTRRIALSVVLSIAVFAGCAGSVRTLSAEEAVTRGAVTNLPLPRFVSIRADSANARRGPGLDHRVDWEFVRRNLRLAKVKVIQTLTTVFRIYQHRPRNRFLDSRPHGGLRRVLRWRKC